MTDFTWHSLPKTLKIPLLHGSTGKQHLLHIVQESLGLINTSSPGDASLFLRLAQQILRHAWEEDPLDGTLAGQLHSLHRQHPFLPPRVLAALHTALKHWRPGEHGRYLNRLQQKKDTERLRRHFDLLLHREPENLYCRMLAFEFGLFFNDLDWLVGHLRNPWSTTLEPFRQAALTKLELALGHVQNARSALVRARSTLPNVLSSLEAELELRLGVRDKALALWNRQTCLNPWMTNTILRLHDAFDQNHTAPALPPGRTSICLYTWNKSMEVGLTLKSLAESSLGEARIFVLDNGSTDQTAHVLDTWQDRLGRERLEVITLPVNIGAPAARNWLMHIPDIKSSEWVVYLDDDVSLPADWLKLLGGAVSAYPSAGVWGCRVVDDQAPHILQSVDYHLKPARHEDHGQGATVSISDLHFTTTDQGQFSYLRPCLHVTGCCHLFSTPKLLECGDFDLRFSPSQFDDLDRDIRSGLKGLPAIYQGHLSVRHMMHSGKLSRKNPDQIGAMLGNRYKLQHKYTGEEFEGLAEWEAALLEKDLLAKIDRMDQAEIRPLEKKECASNI